MIDNISYFESNGVHLLICVFENKVVHAIDSASGDILCEFIFKDDHSRIPEEPFKARRTNLERAIKRQQSKRI